MTTGYDIQRWETCIRKAKENNLELSISGDKFSLHKKGKSKMTNGFLGMVPNLEELFSYLCGYEAANSNMRSK